MTVDGAPIGRRSVRRRRLARRADWLTAPLACRREHRPSAATPTSAPRCRDRAIRKNLTPDDLSAVLRERRGEMILKTDGTPFDHLEEYTGARNNDIAALLDTYESAAGRLP